MVYLCPENITHIKTGYTNAHYYLIGDDNRRPNLSH